jgi:hypothetical protein
VLGVVLALLFAAPAYASFELVSTFGEGASSGVMAEEGLQGGRMAIDDATGDVYVADPGHSRLLRFNSHGIFLEAWGWGVGDGKEEYERCGPDGEIAHCKGREGNGRAFSGEGAGEFQALEGIAVDQATGEIFVDSGHQKGDIQVFNAEGKLLGSFGEEGELTPEQIREGGAIAVSISGDVYLVDKEREPGDQRVMLFERESTAKYKYSREVVKANLWEAEDIALDPQGNIYLRANGGPVGEGVYEFAAGDPSTPAWNHSAPNSAGIAVDPMSGAVFYYSGPGDKVHKLNSATGVELEAFPALKGQAEADGMAFNPSLVWETGSPVGVLYMDNPYGGEPAIQPRAEVFAQPSVLPPRVDGETVADVGSTSVSLQASIAPLGYETRYRFQYGNEDCATHTCAEAPLGGGDLGSGQADLTASAPVSGLQPGTTYHYRVLASNQFGTAEGPDQTFTTYPPLKAGLPDGRSYELVSPAFKDGGEVFPPEISYDCNECTPGENVTPSTIQVAPDGNSIVYEGFPFAATGESVRYNEYRSTRAPSGWQTRDLSPIQETPEAGFYPALATDLSAGVLFQSGFGSTLSSEAPTGYPNLYVEDAEGGLRALVSEPPPNRSVFGGSEANPFELSFGGASADFSHAVFMANDSLTEASEFAPAAEDGGVKEKNVYEWVSGGLSLVNVLPENGVTHAGAVLGSGSELDKGEEGPDYSHAVSADGSRIFWSETATGQVYVRLNGESTLKIPDAGKFLTASTNGSRVLLSDGHIYDLETQRTVDLTVGQGGFQGILGSSEDLSRVYFVDTAALAGSGENASGQEAQAGQDNLYEYDAGSGATVFVASLSATDDELSPQTGDWRATPSNRTAEVTPEGRFLAFDSSASLTGYDNVGNVEVFEYDAETKDLMCTSCARTGVPGRGGSLDLIRPGSSSSTFPQPNGVLADGRVFFDSGSALSPYDTNGVGDVYEYEPSDVGTCSLEGGCVFLISKGTGSEDSEFVGASASGSDVFFMSRDELVPADQDDLEDLYDARVDGGFPEVTQAACTGTGCQGIPSAPPIFATPSSVTFAGVGNFELSPAAGAKVQAKPKKKVVKCAKGKTRKKGKCVKTGKKASKAGKARRRATVDRTNDVRGGGKGR